MEKSSEFLMRSTLHDLANVLAGVRGIIDLNPPGQPINQRDRDRLEAVIEEGISTLNRCRHLTLETLPEDHPEPGPIWREQLLKELQPIGILFRCRFDLSFEGTPEWDQWPGALLRGYARAVTRQALPYAKTDVMNIHGSAGPKGWQIQWTPAPTLPDTLTPGPADKSLDICSRWAIRAGSALGASLSCVNGSLLARIPRNADRP